MSQTVPLPSPAAVDLLLAAARAGLDRVEPANLPLEVEAGALVVDRNVLEWRLDPTSPYCIPQAHAERWRCGGDTAG